MTPRANPIPNPNPNPVPSPNPSPNPSPSPSPSPNPSPNPNQDDTPGGEAASGYSLSFGALRSAIPTGAGGRAFGHSGAGRGLRVLFALSTAARDTVGLGRPNPNPNPNPNPDPDPTPNPTPIPNPSPNLGPDPDPNQVGLGRCEDEGVPSQTCAWRGVRSDLIEVQLDREVLYLLWLYLLWLHLLLLLYLLRLDREVLYLLWLYLILTMAGSTNFLFHCYECSLGARPR